MPVIGFGLPVYEMVDAYTFGVLNELFASWWEFMPDDWMLKPITHRGGPVDANREFVAQALLLDLGDPGAPACCANECMKRPENLRRRVSCDNLSPPDFDNIRQSPVTGRPADVIVWNDSDCFLPGPHHYRRLIDILLSAPTKVGAVAACFPMQGLDKPQPNAIGFDRDGNKRKVTFDGDVHDVEWVGFGCIATRAEVYRAVERPWFKMGVGLEDVTKEDVLKGRFPQTGLGEDARWCYRAREAGFMTCLHTGMLGKHSFRRPQSIDEFQGREEHRTC